MSGTVHRATFDGPLAQTLAAKRPSAEMCGGPWLGRFGLYPNRQLPGGAILHRDPDGFVTSWYTPSAARLAQSWAEIRAACAALTRNPSV